MAFFMLTTGGLYEKI
jgi:hypothetical protein